MAGLGAGLLGAIALTRFLKNLLFEVAPTDPATYSIVIFVLASVALLACALPARRAPRRPDRLSQTGVKPARPAFH